MFNPDNVGAPRAHTGGKPQKYFLDERGRSLIMAHYDGTKEHTEDLAKWLDVPAWLIKKWAQKLGISRNRDPRWTSQEMAYLEKNLRRMTIEDMARHLGRTRSAVQSRIYRIGLYRRSDDGYTMKDLMLGLGVRDHHKVERWVNRGWLKGRKLKTNKDANHQPWLFLDKDIRDFIIAHPEEIDLRHVEKHWFIDLLAGGKYGIGSIDNS